MNLFMGGGKTMDTSILNILKMKKMGFVHIDRVSNGLKQDIVAQYDFQEKNRVQVQAAPFPQASIVVASAIDYSGRGTELIPTDIKSAAEEGKAPRETRVVSTAVPAGAHRVLAAVAIQGRGKRLSGIAMKAQGERADFGAFRPGVAIDDFSEVPAQVPMKGILEGLTSLMVQKRLEKDSEGKPRVGHAMAIVYALPTAVPFQVSWRGLGISDSEVGRYTVSEFEFDRSRFDPGNIDGSRQMESLQRFTRSMATYR
jgi:hypothetical protein